MNANRAAFVTAQAQKFLQSLDDETLFYTQIELLAKAGIDKIVALKPVDEVVEKLKTDGYTVKLMMNNVIFITW